LLLAALFAGGCTTRTLTITSEPSGAEVMLDNKMVGATPTTIPFRYGGANELVFWHKGFEPQVVHYDSERFFFDDAPMDFFTDLGPWHASDHQKLHVVLKKTTFKERYKQDGAGFREGLAARAEMLRKRARGFQLGPTRAAPAHKP